MGNCSGKEKRKGQYKDDPPYGWKAEPVQPVDEPAAAAVMPSGGVPHDVVANGGPAVIEMPVPPEPKCEVLSQPQPPTDPVTDINTQPEGEFQVPKECEVLQGAEPLMPRPSSEAQQHIQPKGHPQLTTIQAGVPPDSQPQPALQPGSQPQPGIQSGCQPGVLHSQPVSDVQPHSQPHPGLLPGYHSQPGVQPNSQPHPGVQQQFQPPANSADNALPPAVGDTGQGEPVFHPELQHQVPNAIHASGDQRQDAGENVTTVAKNVSSSDSSSSSEESSSSEASSDDAIGKVHHTRHGNVYHKYIAGRDMAFGSHAKVININMGGTKRKKKKRKKKVEKTPPVPPQLFQSGFTQNPPAPVISHGALMAVHDCTQSIAVLQCILNCAASVGIIVSHKMVATGFRVGPNYVMTAWHVVDEILKADIRPIEACGYDRNRALANVHIDFSYHHPDQTADIQSQFYFKTKIVYSNKSLDCVILELKHDLRQQQFPTHFTNFGKIEPDNSLYFIAHPEGKVKIYDKAIKPYYLTEAKLEEAQNWSKSHIGHDGFEGINDPNKVLFHCSLTKGASGSPIIAVGQDQRAYVVGMLIHGYPDWFYNDDTPAEKKSGIPSDHLIEQGVRMTAIYDDLTKQKPDVASLIFGTPSR